MFTLFIVYRKLFLKIIENKFAVTKIILTFTSCNSNEAEAIKFKIMKTTLNKTTENFLNWSYKGDGKYYTTEQESRHYLNSIFQKFANHNPKNYVIVGTGNDAPRGGKTGDYVLVTFTKEFKKIATDFLNAKAAKEQAVLDAKKEHNDKVEQVANLITTIEGESWEETVKRLALAADGVSCGKNIFFKAVKLVRKR